MRTPAFSPPIMADVLLHEWENRAFPPHDAAYAAARPLAALLGALVYRRPGDLALDLEDLRDTLRRARAFGLGRATATGPNRATRLVPAAVAACQLAHLGPPPVGLPVLALLHIGSHPAAELEMDELAELTETLQATLGPDADLIFWHHCDEALPPAAMQLWLLLGYPPDGSPGSRKCGLPAVRWLSSRRSLSSLSASADWRSSSIFFDRYFYQLLPATFLLQIMNAPNLFDYATRELSQDAFITWLLQWADPKYKATDGQLHLCAQAFVRLLCNEQESFAITSIKSGRQWKNIDVWAEINDEILLAIEDKTHTGEHSSQLERYKADVETWCSDAERGKQWTSRLVYLKTGDEASGFTEDIRKKGWCTIGRRKLLDFFRKYAEITNAIFTDFREHLERVESNARLFESKELSLWDDNQWKGFYRWLEAQDEIPGKKWFYVSNPAGGFWCYVIDWEQDQNIYPIYWQIESHRGELCLKMATHPDDTGVDSSSENRGAARDSYHNHLINEAKKAGFTGIRRPNRFGNGNYMTVAVIDRKNWLGEADSIVNSTEVLQRLKLYHDFVSNCAENWPSN